MLSTDPKPQLILIGFPVFVKGVPADWGDSARFFLIDTQMTYARFLYNCSRPEVPLIRGLPFVDVVAEFVASKQGTDFVNDLHHRSDNIFSAFDYTAAAPSGVAENLSDLIVAKVVDFAASMLAVVAKRVYCKMADLVAYYY